MTFTLFKIPVRVHFQFLLFAGLLGSIHLDFSAPGAFAQLAIWVCAVTFSVLLHEFGHALVAKKFGAMPAIELRHLMGLTYWRLERRPSIHQRILVTLAGPGIGLLFGLLIAPLALGTADAPMLVQYALGILLWINIGWSLLNLLPMVPLDGGEVLHAILDAMTGDEGAQAARLISVPVAIGAAALALAYGLLFAAILAAYFGLMAATAYWRARKYVGDDKLRPVVIEADRAQRSGDPEAAAAMLAEAVRQVKTREAKGELLELAAWAELAAGRAAQARAYIASMPKGLAPSKILIATLDVVEQRSENVWRDLQAEFIESPAIAQVMRALIAHGRADDTLALLRQLPHGIMSDAAFSIADSTFFHAKQYEHAARIGEIAFERTEVPEHAYNVACSLAQRGNTSDAMTWLERAIKAGYDDFAFLREDPDLAPLRSEPGWNQLLER